MLSTQVHCIAQSSNAKLGKIPATITERKSCPTTCPFKGNGCYAENFPLSLHWNRVGNTTGGNWHQLLEFVRTIQPGRLWRHNVAGDLPNTDGIISRPMVEALATANYGRRGFTYTHHRLTEVNKRTIRHANKIGFTVNVSCHSDAQVDSAIADGLPAVTVCAADPERKSWQTPAGNRVTVCPATYRDDVTCATCGLCYQRHEKLAVAFPVHGAQKRKAAAAVGY